MTAPAPDPLCWPVDLSCCPGWDGYDAATQARAQLLAVSTLQMLTGYRVGGCPVMLRPCRQGCQSRTWATFPMIGGSWAGAGTGWLPVVIGGAWFNVECHCGSTGCSCTQVCEVLLPGEGVVEAVYLDGAQLDADAWRVDSGYRLVRVDGGDCWPLCQDMTADTSKPGTWGVVVSPGLPVDAWGSYAAGVLACEYAKACEGKACRLPSNATSVSRQGVSIELAAGAFPGGRTGIREVDAYLQRFNPYGLVSPSVVWSPDVQRGRVTPYP